VEMASGRRVLHFDEKVALVLLLLLLPGCETIQHHIYNMTPCPIEVTYSVANIKNNTVNLRPGQSAGSIGGGFPRLTELTVVDGVGAKHTCSADELSKLRPSSWGIDRWGYFPDGLHFMQADPSTTPQAGMGDHQCRY